MKKVILPISDLHSETEIEKIIGKFVGTPIDFITISGDVLEKNSDYNLTLFTRLIKLFPSAKIVFISGNHDYAPYKARIRNLGLKDKVFYLENETLTLDGIKFFGCPYSTPFMGWNYMKEEDQIAQVLDCVMDYDIDVALFHQPPHGFGDVVSQRFITGEHLGSHAIVRAINKYKPKYAFYGHIHTGDHAPMEINDVTIGKNVACLNEYYGRDVGHLQTFEIEK